ncbi:MAG: TerD family protein [Ruminococcus sp.]|jgi:tellurium resistance protein TerD|nr:TerD family protein [Ruminococcus sp.]
MADFDGVLSTGMTGHLSAWQIPAKPTGLKKVLVKLFWDAWDQFEDEVHYTLDLSAFLLGADDKARNATDLIFFGELAHESDSVTMVENNLIYIDCKKIPEDIEKIRFAVTIHDDLDEEIVFGTLHNARVKIIDIGGVPEKVLEDCEAHPERYKVLMKSPAAKVYANIDLADGFPDSVTAEAGELFKTGGIWKVRTAARAFDGDLAALCEKHGIKVE